MRPSKRTIHYRINKLGWDAEKAMTTPTTWQRKLNVEDVKSLSTQGLSLNGAAVVFKVATPTLWRFCKNHKIHWHSEGFFPKRGFVVLGSCKAIALKNGLNPRSLQQNAERNEITFEQAALRMIDYRNKRAKQ